MQLAFFFMKREDSYVMPVCAGQVMNVLMINVCSSVQAISYEMHFSATSR